MLKILIVDDEKSTRDVIKNLIDWNKYNISWVGEAEDGSEALAAAVREKPDILLTDVKMPKMNGIELAEKIRGFLPNCKIIYLSGYSDKEYLKAAIRYKAVSYIEKPVVLDEINEVLKSAVDECRMENEHRERIIDDESSVLCLDLLNQNMDQHIINNKIAALQQLSFPISGYYSTVIIHFKTYDTEFVNEQDIIHKECLYKLKKYLNRFNKKHILGYKGNNHLLIHFALENDEFEEIKILLQEYLDDVRSLSSSLIISAALGTPEKGLEGIPTSYRTAVTALQQRFFKGTKNILVFSKASSSAFIFEESWIKNISEALVKNSMNDTMMALKRLTFEIRKAENTNPDYIRNIYFRIVMLLSMHAKDRNIQLLNDECSFILDSVTNALTLDEIEAEMQSLINSFFSYMQSNQAVGNLIVRITEYIHKNYTDPTLSVNAIAQEIYLTASYLCVFFKKGSGKTLNHYITEYRIEKAKELLRSADVKIANVAENVGYTDAKYFTRVFEKMVGIKPKKYRELHYDI